MGPFALSFDVTDALPAEVTQGSPRSAISCCCRISWAWVKAPAFRTRRTPRGTSWRVPTTQRSQFYARLQSGDLHANLPAMPRFVKIGAGHFCLGERDVSPDPHSADFTLHILPRSAHCQNFASTRQRMWNRMHHWARSSSAS